MTLTGVATTLVVLAIAFTLAYVVAVIIAEELEIRRRMRER